ncbi:ExeM/NucH family extracellular endonuclease [Microbacterium allomyrinae]|uniref:ExeM/NucH family extracellular endonuclease n=1 Tax=Microbacterium allomyrinae TaxID=2830666 RepID=A0A9X1LV45_9MICO|nr:ExeM/NucH family extracellular endonuclease [Microbacterium allomyrinae]MCC2032737.1 ExeM/NucH family extracellular endonuclease [Microbacterium allomyrinae]
MSHLPRRLVAASAAFALVAAGVVAFAAPASAASGDLLLSEYIEGSSFNKAIEIYNPSTAPVDLAAAGYKIDQYSNGATNANPTVALTGTIAPDDVFVVAHASADPAILAVADLTTSVGLFNGDDAVALVKGTAVVDVIGQIGVDPGAEWGTALASTADNTLRRAAATCVGDAVGTDAFDPASGWVGFANGTFDGLGAHDADCALEPGTDPDPDPDPVADCDLDAVTIGSVQGPGSSSPVAGEKVLVEGVVVGDFQQAGGYDGYYVQDAGDGDSATSDGVFVYAPGGAAVQVGDAVSVVGEAGERFGLTEIVAAGIEICASAVDLPAPVPLTLPATPEQREALEGMSVTLPQQLTIGETFEFGRFGTITLTVGRQHQPTGLYDAGSAEAVALAAQNVAESITVDDGRGSQNPDPAIHPNGDVFTLANTFRSGDLVTNTTGILDYRFDTWGIQPTEGADFAVGNPRTAAPEVGGELKVASFNVLNYFTTLTGPDARGANDAAEFERQEAKIVTALAEIDADVFGLIEIENNGTAVATLTAALNERLGGDGDVYRYIDTGVIGTDVITTALIYKPASVTPAGAFQLMEQEDDARWLDDFNRPALTQTFADAAGAEVTVVVNHLKSKGSDCNAVNDPIDPNGQGNCNGVRTQAAAALADWLATDPTGEGAGRELIMGDLNSYAQEDPIQVLTGAGFTDLLAQFQGADAYSYVFDGQLGYLDYALAGGDVLDEVAEAAVWNVNADEPSLIDYDMSFKAPAQDALYAEDAYRSSDHDPVIVGLNLTPPDTLAPTIEATALPSFILVPNNKDRAVRMHIDAEDESGDVSVALTDVTVAGSTKAAWEQTGDRTFTVKAVNGARYTFTWTATDAAGNTATDTAVVVVGVRGLLGLF